MLVIKRIIILSILIFLSSCLLFRNDYKKEENINTLKKLITEDGTYLSDDNANEITPFILVYPDYSNSESRASGGYIVITTNYFESNRLYIITNYYLHNYNTIITNVLSLDNTNFIEIYYPANSSEVKEVIYFTNVCFIHTNYVYSEGPHIAITNSFVSNGITNYVITKYYYNIDDYYYRIQNMTITNSKSILLFSSDREGDYNIYFAEKNTNNIFKRIIKFDDLISTKGNNEYSPVIFVLDRVSLISFIREDSQGRKKIVNYLLTNGPYPDQNTYSEYHAGDIKHIGIVRGIDKPELIVSYGKNFLSNLSWDFSNKNWKPKSRIYTYSNVYSAEAYEDLIYDGTNMYKKRVYALELIKDSNSQLALGIETNYGLFSIITLISNYSSIYNDKFPSIEPLKDAGSFLYFSSDRYGKGNYDIFRYNNNTFDKIVNPYGVKGIVDNSIRLLKTNYNHTNVGTNLVFNYSYPTPHLRWEEINATNINLSWLYIYMVL